MQAISKPDLEKLASRLETSKRSKLTLPEMAENFASLRTALQANTLEEVAAVTKLDVRFVRRVLSIAGRK